MQWSRGGGFSEAEPVRGIPGGSFAPERVNVADQKRDPDSLLRWFQLLIERYRECPELAWGENTVLETGNPGIFAHRCDAAGATVVAVHNLGDTATEVELLLKDRGDCVLTDLLSDESMDVEDGRVTLPMAPHGCRWLRAAPREDMPPEDASIIAR